MALAAVTATRGDAHVVELLASAIAVNGLPTGDAGIALDAGFSSDQARGRRPLPKQIRVAVNSTAGSGTMTVTLRVWGRAGGIWFRLKDLNASSAAPHTAVAIPETTADSIKYSEVVECVDGCDRLYLEIVAIAGTSTAVTGYAIFGA